MSDKLKYSPEMVRAYEQIVKFYDYKSNPNICRLTKSTKYPRYTCCEDANPDIVYNLFMHVFIDKIITNDIMHCISKLPSVIVRSMEAMVQEMGAGPYGIQIFDASTDLLGKPIIICQMFKVGRNAAEIIGETKSLKLQPPCDISNFQIWLSEKRAIGLATLKSKIQDILRARRAVVIGESNGGGDAEHIITLYYDNTVQNSGSVALETMLDKIVNLKYKHATHTIEHYQKMTEPRKRSVISLNKREGCSDPFA